MSLEGTETNSNREARGASLGTKKRKTSMGLASLGAKRNSQTTMVTTKKEKAEISSQTGKFTGTILTSLTKRGRNTFRTFTRMETQLISMLIRRRLV
jgi:hypothetical protein